MIGSSKLGNFLVVFSIAAVVLYTAIFMSNWTPFTYFPALGTFGLGRLPATSETGPVMYWYGWIAADIVAALVIALFAIFLPETVLKRIPASLLWILPIIGIIFVGYGLSGWFLR